MRIPVADAAPHDEQHPAGAAHDAGYRIQGQGHAPLVAAAREADSDVLPARRVQHRPRHVSGRGSATGRNAYHYFRALLGHSCLPFHINNPCPPTGSAAAAARSPARPTNLCHLLPLPTPIAPASSSAASTTAGASRGDLALYAPGGGEGGVSVPENEDEATFLAATCRAEFLVAQPADTPGQLSFVEAGEGSIHAALGPAHEKHLRLQLTRRRVAPGATDTTRTRALLNEDNMDDLEVALRELAFGDWAHALILDGFSPSPSPAPSGSYRDDCVREVEHLRTAPAAVVRARHGAHAAAMRRIAPPMRNVVRRVVVECSLDARGGRRCGR
ncbi:hypothetical protein B0H10DRAFT_2202797 [Mycena sp. CBHHK59/15]|nr:hypothetical protein B0H10DRAFT_2202797 [Mycena sp. CBHHK59/15]